MEKVCQRKWLKVIKKNMEVFHKIDMVMDKDDGINKFNLSEVKMYSRFIN